MENTVWGETMGHMLFFSYDSCSLKFAIVSLHCFLNVKNTIKIDELFFFSKMVLSKILSKCTGM